jgi:hypothetical protein
MEEIEILAIWGLINHLEEEVELLEEMDEKQPLTKGQKEKYNELNKSIAELMDKIDDGDD